MTEEQAAIVRKWQRALRLSEWWVGISDVPCDDMDMRSMVDIDRNLHRAVIRFDATLPNDQMERQIVHELLHVRLAELEDVFRQVVGEDGTADTWWHRAEERTIEALTDHLVPHQPRRDYAGGPAWVTAKDPS